MYLAILSLTLPVGLNPSSFAYIFTFLLGLRLLISTSGVLPIVSISDLYSMAPFLLPASFHHNLPEICKIKEQVPEHTHQRQPVIPEINILVHYQDLIKEEIYVGF